MLETTKGEGHDRSHAQLRNQQHLPDGQKCPSSEGGPGGGTLLARPQWRVRRWLQASGLMAYYTREQVREAVERGGDEHWQALIRHHEDAYPASPPTPGDVCRAEAERLNQLGRGDAGDLTLVETRVERTDSTIRIVHHFKYGPHKARLLTEPFEGYGSE